MRCRTRTRQGRKTCLALAVVLVCLSSAPQALAQGAAEDAYQAFSRVECRLVETARQTDRLYVQLAGMLDRTASQLPASSEKTLRSALDRHIAPTLKILRSLEDGSGLSADLDDLDGLSRSAAAMQSIASLGGLASDARGVAETIRRSSEDLIKTFEERLEIGSIINDNGGIVELDSLFVANCAKMEFGFVGTWHPASSQTCDVQIHLYSGEEQSWVTGEDSNLSDCSEMVTENVPRNTPQNSRRLEQKNHLVCKRADRPQDGFIEQNDHFVFELDSNNTGTLRDLARQKTRKYTRCSPSVVRGPDGHYTLVAGTSQYQESVVPYDRPLISVPVQIGSSGDMADRPHIFKVTWNATPQLGAGAHRYCAKILENTRSAADLLSRVPVAHMLCGQYLPLAIRMVANEYPELNALLDGYTNPLADEMIEGFQSIGTGGTKLFKVRVTDTGAPSVRIDRPGMVAVDKAFVRSVTIGTVYQYFGGAKQFRDFVVSTANLFVSGGKYSMTRVNMAELPRVKRNGDEYIELAQFDEFIGRPEQVIDDFENAVSGQIQFAMTHESGHDQLGHTKRTVKDCSERRAMEWAADEFAIRTLATIPPTFGSGYERYGFERFLRHYGEYGFDVVSPDAACQYGEGDARLRNALRYYRQIRGAQ